MRHGIKVLVADDDHDVRVLVRAMLEAAGFDVVGEAADGREAVARTAELEPDVVLMDLMMPVMDGEVRFQDLRFDEGEAATFLEKSLGTSLRAATRTRLYDSTEGWPVGLRLAPMVCS